jgi:protein-tyrosine-phosphatase
MFAVCLYITYTQSLYAQSVPYSSTKGREFWLAIPHNDGLYRSSDAINIYLWVAADTTTSVRLVNHYTNDTLYRIIAAPKHYCTFGTIHDDFSRSMELRVSEVISHKGIQITSDNPVTVFCLTDSPGSSDGFQVLPTKIWGRHYIHCSYFDLHERDFSLGGGFNIIAAEDNTQVLITLKGINNGDTCGRTEGNRALGDVIPITLNKGDTYLVRGNGKTIGSFDLTGTDIQASKPIGVISSHRRTSITHLSGFGNRDILCEFLPPVETWTTSYVGLPFQTIQGKGDLVRVIASEDSTLYTITWNNIAGDSIEQYHGYLDNSGDWDSYHEGYFKETNGVNGTFIITANKPIFAMQYMYSGDMYGSMKFDPCMLNVASQGQFSNGIAQFVVPPFASSENHLTLLVRGDTSDHKNREKQFSSLLIDDKKILSTYPKLLHQRVLNSDIFWVRIPNVSSGFHQLVSKNNAVSFAATGYGFSHITSYCWTIAQAYHHRQISDTLPPQFLQQNNITSFDIIATEERNFASMCASCPKQEESGIAEVEILPSRSWNIERIFIDNPVDGANNATVRFSAWSFQINVEDTTQPAKAVFYAMDKAGNMVIDSIQFIPWNSTLPPTESSMESLPSITQLLPASPNPARKSTTIRYSLATQQDVIITLYSANGKLISTFTENNQPAGNHHKLINVEHLPEGEYFYIFQAGTYTARRPLQIIK